MFNWRQTDLPMLRAEVTELIRAHDALYGRVCVRAVAMKLNDGWNVTMCSVEAYAPGEAPQPVETLDYGSTLLAEAWLLPEEIDPFLDDVVAGEVTVDGRRLRVVLAGEGHSHDRTAAAPLRGGHPMHDFVLHGVEQRNLPLTPIFCGANPYFPDLVEAIALWVGPPGYSYRSDGRNGSVLVHLPELRGRIAGLAHDEGKLRVVLDAAETTLASLRLRGMYWRSTGAVPIVRDDLVGRLEIEMPHDTYRLDLLLLTDKDEALDWHVERPPYELYPIPRGFVLNHSAAVLPGDDEQRVRQVLDAGEGVNAEFKPFVRLGDTKMNEVVRTTIAFANTSGGIIFLGVDDECRPDGSVDRGLLDLKRDRQITDDEALQVYLGAVRQALVSSLHRAPPIRTTSVSVDNRTIVLVIVSEGTDKPYAKSTGNDVWVRRGASNVRPHPEHDIYKSSARPDGRGAR